MSVVAVLVLTHVSAVLIGAVLGYVLNRPPAPDFLDRPGRPRRYPYGQGTAPLPVDSLTFEVALHPRAGSGACCAPGAGAATQRQDGRSDRELNGRHVRRAPMTDDAAIAG